MENSKYDLTGEFGKIYAAIMAMRRNEDFVVNPIQMDKFLDLVNFFCKKAEEEPDDFVDASGFQPKEQNGDVTATFQVFDIWGDEVPEFCDVLRACSVVTIDPGPGDKVCINCTVPEVFVRKDGKDRIY